MNIAEDKPITGTIDLARLRSPQDFYEAVNVIHTAAMDYLPDTNAAPVMEALERCMDRLADMDEVLG